MWGLNESVKKGRITFYLWDWDNPLGQVWTCLGAVGIAINKRPSYPHLIIFWTTSRLCPCGGSILVASASAPGMTRRHDGGMGHQSRLESVSIPSLGGGRVDHHPSFSLSLSPFLFLYLLSLSYAYFRSYLLHYLYLSPSYAAAVVIVLRLSCPIMKLSSWTFFSISLSC